MSEINCKKRNMNSYLCNIYKSVYKTISKAGIPLLLTAFLSGVYALFVYFTNHPLLSNYFLYNGIQIEWVILCLVGMLSFEDANDIIEAVIIYPRVSSQSQEDGTSLDHQEDILHDEFSKLDTSQKEIICNEWESAETMLRDTIDEIIKRVRNTETKYCLMFRSVDRLSRANPLEACVFLWIMKRNDVVLYFDDLGYLDLSNLNQVMLLIFRLIQSRDEYLRIVNRGDQGRKKSKEEGKYPAKAPFGYEKNGEDKLRIVDEEAEVIQRVVNLYLSGDETNNVPSENVKKAVEQVETEFDIDLPEYESWFNILRRELYTGRIKHEGDVVERCPQIISERDFDDVIQRLGQSDDKNPSDDDFELMNVVEKFGVRSSHYMFGDRIKFSCPGCGSKAVDVDKTCPDCGGEIRKWGSTERWGHSVKEYKCENHPDFIKDDTNDVTTCEFKGPLLSDQFLREWHDTVPVTCPLCQLPLDEDAWEVALTQIGAIKQTCDCCGTNITLNVDKNKYMRKRNNLGLSIQFFDDDNGGGADKVKNKDNEEDNDEEDDEEDDQSSQSEIENFN
ncbi:MAG: recombinase family protein [Candidatus Nanohaloarchaea archaeon]